MNNKTAKKNMQVKRVDHPNRPQEPKAPYPYNAEEVTFENKAANVTLAGTLTIPLGNGPFPAVLLIAGSGPHARDAMKGGHKTMLVLADHLTRQSIAVLRFDKRGCGASTGNFATATSADFASDVQAGIEYLKSRKEINIKQIGLVGHSEGGLIASMVAATSQDLTFVVIMASPGVIGEDLEYEQCALMSRAAGETEEAVMMEHKLLLQICTTIKQEPDNQTAKEKICTIYAEYMAQLSEAQKKIYGNLFLKNEVSDILSSLPWFRFFLALDPVSALKKVTVPVLAFFCERDLVVPIKQNLLPFSKALKESGNKDYTILQMPELNHLFQHCNIGTEKEYATIEETISPEVLKIIAKWISERTIKKGPHA